MDKIDSIYFDGRNAKENARVTLLNSPIDSDNFDFILTEIVEDNRSTNKVANIGPSSHVRAFEFIDEHYTEGDIHVRWYTGDIFSAPMFSTTDIRLNLPEWIDDGILDPDEEAERMGRLNLALYILQEADRPLSPSEIAKIAGATSDTIAVNIEKAIYNQIERVKTSPKEGVGLEEVRGDDGQKRYTLTKSIDLPVSITREPYSDSKGTIKEEIVVLISKAPKDPVPLSEICMHSKTHIDSLNEVLQKILKGQESGFEDTIEEVGTPNLTAEHTYTLTAKGEEIAEDLFPLYTSKYTSDEREIRDQWKDTANHPKERHSSNDSE